ASREILRLSIRPTRTGCGSASPHGFTSNDFEAQVGSNRLECYGDRAFHVASLSETDLAGASVLGSPCRYLASEPGGNAACFARAGSPEDRGGLRGRFASVTAIAQSCAA